MTGELVLDREQEQEQLQRRMGPQRRIPRSLALGQRT